MPKNLPESKIIVHAWDFLEALRAAVVFTDNDHPGVRLDVVEEDSIAHVSALVTNQIVSITADLSWCDFVDDEHRGFELTIKQVRDILQIFKNWKRRTTSDDDEDDQPLIGIRVTAEDVGYYDESGLGLTIKRLGHERASLDMPTVIPDRLAEALDSLPGEETYLTVKQLQDLAKAANAVGHEPALYPLEPGKYRKSTTFISCGPLRSVATVSADEPAEQEPAPGQESASFEDPDEEDADTDDRQPREDGMHLVTTRPVGGVA